MVVRSRLIDASASTPVTASDALVGKLGAAGIYPVQNWDTSILA
jgi:hypothetical protein